jgi:hypothetical protein
LVIGGSSAWSRPLAEPLVDLHAITAETSAALPGARTDSLFLFASSGPGSHGSPGTTARFYSYDDDGQPAPADWAGIDLTTQLAHWHVADAHIVDGHGTDMSQALPFDSGDTENDYALWCGRQNVCEWIDPDGYGNNWDQMAVVSLDPPASGDLGVECAYNADFEGYEYDYFLILVRDDQGLLHEIYRNDIEREQTFQWLSIGVNAGDLGVEYLDELHFRFTSDSGWSDEDGLVDSDIGAVWLDNIVVTVSGNAVFAADFEDGFHPEGLRFETPGGVGNFAALYAGLAQDDPPHQNDSHLWGFFDPDTGTLPPGAENPLQSPVLDRAHALDDPAGSPVLIDENTDVRCRFDVYVDEGHGVMPYAEIQVAAFRQESDCLGDYRSEPTVYLLQPGWNFIDRSIVHPLAESAAGETIAGLALRIDVKDFGLRAGSGSIGERHLPTVYGHLIDNVGVALIGVETGVEAPGAEPPLLTSHPNPFNPQTTLSFTLPAASRAELVVHDLAGRALCTLLDERLPAGAHAVAWDGRDDGGRTLASGVYLASLRAGELRQARRLVLLK